MGALQANHRYWPGVRVRVIEMCVHVLDVEPMPSLDTVSAISHTWPMPSRLLGRYY